MAVTTDTTIARYDTTVTGAYFDISQVVSDGTDLTYRVFVYDSAAAKAAKKQALENLNFTVKPADTGTEADAVTTALGTLMSAINAHLSAQNLTSI